MIGNDVALNLIAAEKNGHQIELTEDHFSAVVSDWNIVKNYVRDNADETSDFSQALSELGAKIIRFPDGEQGEVAIDYKSFDYALPQEFTEDAYDGQIVTIEDFRRAIDICAELGTAISITLPTLRYHDDANQTNIIKQNPDASKDERTIISQFLSEIIDYALEQGVALHSTKIGNEPQIFGNRLPALDYGEIAGQLTAIVGQVLDEKYAQGSLDRPLIILEEGQIWKSGFLADQDKNGINDTYDIQQGFANFINSEVFGFSEEEKQKIGSYVDGIDIHSGTVSLNMTIEEMLGEEIAGITYAPSAARNMHTTIAFWKGVAPVEIDNSYLDTGEMEVHNLAWSFTKDDWTKHDGLEVTGGSNLANSFSAILQLHAMSTAGVLSGFNWSPLGNFDNALWWDTNARGLDYDGYLTAGGTLLSHLRRSFLGYEEEDFGFQAEYAALELGNVRDMYYEQNILSSAFQSDDRTLIFLQNHSDEERTVSFSLSGILPESTSSLSLITTAFSAVDVDSAMNVGSNLDVEFSPFGVLSGDFVFEVELSGFEIVQLSIGHGRIGYETVFSQSADHVNGSFLSDSMALIGGDDVAYGWGGDDLLFGGEGHDTLVGGLGDDTILGGVGNDVVEGGAGNDELHGGVGNDTIDAADGFDFVSGGEGNDQIILSGSKYFGDHYTAFNDSSVFQVGTQERVNLEGLLRIDGFVDGGAGFDSIQLSEESDAFFFHEFFFETWVSTDHTVDDLGILSQQRIANIEAIVGMGGDDFIDLTSWAFSLAGLNIDVDGGEGNDIVWGSDATEVIRGGAGDDTLFGGVGGDTLVGGSGADTFDITETSGGTTILDFNPLEGDVLRIFRSDRFSGDFSLNGISLTDSGILVESTIFLGDSVPPGPEDAPVHILLNDAFTTFFAQLAQTQEEMLQMILDATVVIDPMRWQFVREPDSGEPVFAENGADFTSDGGEEVTSGSTGSEVTRAVTVDDLISDEFTADWLDGEDVYDQSDYVSPGSSTRVRSSVEHSLFSSDANGDIPPDFEGPSVSYYAETLTEGDNSYRHLGESGSITLSGVGYDETSLGGTEDYAVSEGHGDEAVRDGIGTDIFAFDSHLGVDDLIEDSEAASDGISSSSNGSDVAHLLVETQTGNAFPSHSDTTDHSIIISGPTMGLDDFTLSLL